jgi:hypothetical protein
MYVVQQRLMCSKKAEGFFTTKFKTHIVHWDIRESRFVQEALG